MPKVNDRMGEFGSEFVNKISDKHSEEGWAETAPFGQSSEDVDCMACGNARVENLELNFMEPSPEMVPHVASNVVFE